MAIELVRIDDRLIHGQVATTWIKDYAIDQAIIVDDDVAADKMQQSVIDMTAPVGVKVHIFAVDRFIKIYKKNPIKRRSMLVLTSSVTALRLAEGGVAFDVLNVGGMRFKEGREKIARAVSVTPEEREAFEKILDRGIDVQVQMVPRDEMLHMSDILK